MLFQVLCFFSDVFGKYVFYFDNSDENSSIAKCFCDSNVMIIVIIIIINDCDMGICVVFNMV